MNQEFTAKTLIVINTSAANVWKALTEPNLIKQYFFGTEVITDWQVGSPISYKGVWQEKTYEDKGKILEVNPKKRLVSTYWSSMGGKPDIPENYNTIAYDLSSDGEKTRLTVTQTNIATDMEREHSEKNWTMILNGLKKLLEQ